MSKEVVLQSRRTRVFALLLTTFSAVCLICGLVNLSTQSYSYFTSTLVSLGLSIAGVLVGFIGFRTSQTLSKAGLILYTTLVSLYALSFLCCIVLISVFEYSRYLHSHSWELKTSLGVTAVAIFLLVSTVVCWYGSSAAYRLSRSLPTLRTDSQELEPIIERVEDGPEGASSRNPMTQLPQLDITPTLSA